jgi:hypothetical protein
VVRTLRPPKEEDNSGCMDTPRALKGNIKPTGTGLDQTLFFTMETAREIARASRTMAEKPLTFRRGRSRR